MKVLWLIFFAACGGNAAHRSLTASTPNAPADGVSAIEITHVQLIDGKPFITGAKIAFSTTLGKVDPEIATPDAEGFARTTLTSTKPGSAYVTAEFDPSALGAESPNPRTTTVVEFLPSP